MSKQLKFAHLNLRSIFTNFDVLKEYIISENVDIFAMSETWLNPEVDYDYINIPNYVLVTTDRQGRGGGAGFFIRNTINYKILLSEISDALEHVWISITYSGKHVIFGALYRPPKSNVLQSLDLLNNAMSHLVPTSDNIIFAGDFNLNLLRPNYSGVDHFNNFLESFNLTQLVNEPTRVTSQSSTLIDILVASDKDLINSIKVSDSNGISDHFLVSCFVTCIKSKISPKLVTYREFKYFNEERFQYDLHSINWDYIYTLHSADDMVDYFNCNIIKLFDLHAPLRTVKITKRRAPWLTDTIREMQELRNAAFSKYKLSRSNHDWESYKNIRNYVTGAIHREKKAYLSHILKNKCSKTTWNTLRSLDIVKNTQQHELPNLLRNVNNINTYFNNISVPIPTADQAKLLDKYSSSKFVSNCSFCFTTVDTDVVMKHILSIKSHSVGCDLISITMLKLVSSFLLHHITFIINTCILTSTYPRAWKTACVVPLAKNSNPIDLSHLRPISILPTLSKVLELILKSQISNYVFDNNIIPAFQSGFRPHHSTTTALLHISDYLLKATDDSQVTCLILLDFSKAFDTLDPNILYNKLLYYGFEAGAASFIYNYLCDRSQKVTVDSEESTTLPVYYGVPQGSILGPLLFSIYISDFHQSLNMCNIHHYADDSQVYLSFPIQDVVYANELLNKELSSLSCISVAHRLKLNPSKSQVIVFGPKKSRDAAKLSLNIKIGNNSINTVNQCKNLGLWFDENLRFTRHVNYLCQSSYLTLKQLYPHKNIMTSELKLNLCNALIISKISYCDSVYGPALLNMDSIRLQRIQNSCYRFAFGIRKYQSGISNIIQNSGNLKLDKLRKLHLLCITHKILGSSTPSYLFNKLRKLHRNSANFKTRHSLLLEIPRHATAMYTRSFTYNASKEYNSLPSEFKNYTIKNFKKKLKKFLL